MELREQISKINTLLSEYYKYYPKKDWDETTLKSLINDFSYHSNKIEGLKMNYGETIKFLNTGMLEHGKLSDGNTISDISMLSNHKKALKLVFEEYHNPNISIKLIKDLHREIMTTNDFNKDEENKPGFFRGDDIGVLRRDGSFKYFIYDTQIEPELNKLVTKNKRS